VIQQKKVKLFCLTCKKYQKIYLASMNHKNTLSFWEQQHLIAYDFIVVGSGIVGLSAAISLAEKYPTASIAVLERGILPTGASTRNAGFACFGSLTELLADAQLMPIAEVLTLVQTRWQGLQSLRKRLGDAAIGLENFGGYELIGEKELPALEEIAKVNQWLLPIFGEEVYVRKDEKIAEFGFNSKKVKALIFNKFEAQIDTGKMMKALLQTAQRYKITVLTGCLVQSWEDQNEEVQVNVQDTTREDRIIFSAKKLLLCTNAFTKNLLPALDIQAGRGQILLTKPIKNLPFCGTFHYDEGYFYFRNVGNCILLGGGRNLDFAGEQTLDIHTTDYIIDYLKNLLQEVIAPNLVFEIDQQWAGIMAFGEVKKPIIQWYSPNVLLGVRCGGMGVAIGTKVGEMMAAMVSMK
jgi:glycine/D-amino acid oxidase-like deaminating enzyme